MMRFVAVQAKCYGPTLALVAGGAGDVAAFEFASPAILGVVQLMWIVIVVSFAGVYAVGVTLILLFQDFYDCWMLSIESFLNGLTNPQAQLICDIVQYSLSEHLLKTNPIVLLSFSLHYPPYSTLHKFIPFYAYKDYISSYALVLPSILLQDLQIYLIQIDKPLHHGLKLHILANQTHNLSLILNHENQPRIGGLDMLYLCMHLLPFFKVGLLINNFGLK